MTKSSFMMNKIVLYDYLRVNGGAERFVCNYIKNNHDYKLLVSTIYKDYKLPEYLHRNKIITLFNHSYAINLFTYLYFKYSKIEILKTSNNVIYNGIYSILSEHNQINGKKVYYCHTPPRFLYDRKIEYLNKYNRISRNILKIFFKLYRRSYEEAVQNMDIILTNSYHMKKQIKKMLNINSKVVYPPIDNNFKWISQSDYYLSVGRLEKNKRIELIIEAFSKLPNKKLIITSGGSQYLNFKKICDKYPNITMTNWTSDNKLVELIGNAIACIYIPRDEDLGISALESQKAGKPVISVKEGGLTEIIKDRYTGYLLEKNPSSETLIEAINYMDKDRAMRMRKACEEYSNNFTDDNFFKNMNLYINKN